MYTIFEAVRYNATGTGTSVSAINRFILRVKRGETPAYKAIKSLARRVLNPRCPRLPNFLKPPLRALYELHFGIIVAVRLVLTIFYRNPIFQARCASVGKNLQMDGLPYVSGHVEIHIGNDVWLGGKISILSGAGTDEPKLIIKDRSGLGWNVQVAVNKEVLIEEDVKISYDCRISDSDGHPREADLRAQHAPVRPEDIRPVRICRYAWIGNGAHIMKGVTIGEGAIIGANSVVISDIPPYCIAMGNPAEVYFRNVGKPVQKPDAAAGTRS